MKIYGIGMITWIINLFYICQVTCFFDPFTASAVIGAGTGLYYGYNYLKCNYNECCNDNYISNDISELSRQLKANLFGQNHAINEIEKALIGHKKQRASKALTMAFHGPPGTGKNYVAGMIRDIIYKKGIASKYYHFFNGRSQFPLDSKKDIYKEQLTEIIKNALLDCPKSMFVFDEVDEMAEGVLDAIVPFIDHGPTQMWINQRNEVIETRDAIFIFLCNAGSRNILDKMISFWMEGKSRDDIKFVDFENLITIAAFNDKGGFHKSGTIRSNLIDHYIPFLPLEMQHVERCIKVAFQDYGVYSPTAEQIEEIMSYVTYGPEPYNLYANSGCKRLERKVASIAYKRNFN